MNDKLHDIEDIRELLGGVGRTSVFALISSGELGSVRVGRRRMVPRSQIDAYIARHLEVNESSGELAPHPKACDRRL